MAPVIHTYRVVYRFADDDTEYAATLDECSPEAAAAALQRLPSDKLTVVRVELVEGL